MKPEREYASLIKERVVPVVTVVLLVLPRFGGHSLVAHTAPEGGCPWTDPTDGPKSSER
ncbi:MAG: hypothetical protein QOG21_1858, partial [Actinomycetota bacterium]|nr:hypothetical protein [Actinomycetota bacterium]